MSTTRQTIVATATAQGWSLQQGYGETSPILAQRAGASLSMTFDTRGGLVTLAYSTNAPEQGYTPVLVQTQHSSGKRDTALSILDTSSPESDSAVVLAGRAAAERGDIATVVNLAEEAEERITAALTLVGVLTRAEQAEERVASIGLPSDLGKVRAWLAEEKVTVARNTDDARVLRDLAEGMRTTVRGCCGAATVEDGKGVCANCAHDALAAREDVYAVAHKVYTDAVVASRKATLANRPHAEQRRLREALDVAHTDYSAAVKALRSEMDAQHA